jgi:hypothetical protein
MYECARDWLAKYPLDCHHIHLLRALFDCIPEASQLQDKVGAIDLENPGRALFDLTESRIVCLC